MIDAVNHNKRSKSHTGTKFRILYLYQYLVHNSDPEHPVSTRHLIGMLKRDYGIEVNRNTVGDDMHTLHDCGMGIKYYDSTQNQYYYDGQVYESYELKLLVDAISSSKFITEAKSQDLIAKLLKLANKPDAELLRRHVTTGRVKSDNEKGYYIVDLINRAIDLHRRIRFFYTDFDINKQRYVTNAGLPYTLSPYDLYWDGDYYYVRGFCDERQEMRNFRLDLIYTQPEMLDEIAAMPPAGYNPVKYSKEVFRMFDTEKPVDVELLCDVSTMKYLIDHFGIDFESEPVDDHTFKAKVNVCTSTTFYRWIFGFKGKMKIQGPELVKDEYKLMLTTALEQ